MIVVVDCDGLKPEATADLMQGSRFQFCEGTVYGALEQRVIATLKGDPDLRRLEEEAEDDISSLQAGSEAVTQALDQLIEAHHDAGTHVGHGQGQPGEATRDDTSGPLAQTKSVVIDADPSVGAPATDPVLLLRPDVATLRLKPNEARKFFIHPRPDAAWKELETITVTLDPPVKEMLLSRATQTMGEEVTVKFVEPDDVDEDEYPIEATLRATAMFKGHSEARILERRVVVTPKKKPPGPRKKIELKDEPTFIRVTSRQPIKLQLGGPDLHVKMKWDGKDELVGGTAPTWTMTKSCESPSVDPPCFLTQPVEGRFEMLIQWSQGLTAGEQIKFDVEAVGPGRTLATSFLVDVVEPPSARKISAKLPGGGQRRPPYELKTVTKDKWDSETNWGGTGPAKRRALSTHQR